MGIEPVVVVGGLLVKSPFTAESEVPIFRVAVLLHSPPRLASPNRFRFGHLPLLSQLYHRVRVTCTEDYAIHIHAQQLTTSTGTRNLNRSICQCQLTSC